MTEQRIFRWVTRFVGVILTRTDGEAARLVLWWRFTRDVRVGYDGAQIHLPWTRHLP